MENKLIEGINNILNGVNYKGNSTTEEFFTLTSDVSMEFSKWCSWKYLLGSDGKTWIPRFSDQRKQDDWKTIEQLFNYFIEHIYPALDKNNLNK